jgi:hypothetical protein
MVKEVTFSLDTDAAADIIGDMMMPTVGQSGRAIQSRAQSMASSQSSKPPAIKISTAIGTIKRGRRAIATISIQADDAHQAYIGAMALRKAKDAGRLK